MITVEVIYRDDKKEAFKCLSYPFVDSGFMNLMLKNEGRCLLASDGIARVTAVNKHG